MDLKKNSRKVLILAAGMGSRLMPLTADRPKCLVRVGGQPILFWQLAALSACGAKDIVIVTGYLGSMVEKYVLENFLGFSVQFVRNSSYQTTEKLHSWFLARDSVAEGAIVLDSDIIFHPKIISSTFSLSQEVSAGCFHQSCGGEEDTMVAVGANGEILDIGKNLPQDQRNAKFAGIYIFSKNFSRFFFETAERLLNSSGQHAFGFDAIKKIREERGLVLQGLDVSKYPFVEVDSPRDISIAEAEIIPHVAFLADQLKLSGKS